MKKVIALLFVFFTQIVVSQSNIKLNQKAPEITITDWVLNVPKDKNLNNKFIVLEFWATWCAPCIKAVPHLNEIQEKTKRKDLYFISITDESVEKINRVAKRIQFNSIVVSDQSKKTQINFGNGIDRLEAYPFTVLIDNKGIIKWIDLPQNLTEEIINDFVSNKLKPTNAFIQDEVVANPTSIDISSLPNYDDDFTKYQKILLNKDILFTFEIVKIKNSNRTSSIGGNTDFLYTSISVKEIFNQILEYNPNLIDIDANLNRQRYKMVYKNLAKNNEFKLEENILNFLNLKKSTLIKDFTVNKIIVKKEQLLEETLDEEMSSKSVAGTKLLIVGITIKNLVKELHNYSKDIFEFNSDSNDKSYDFVIDITTPKSIINSLNSYGLEVKTESEALEMVKIEAN